MMNISDIPEQHIVQSVHLSVMCKEYTKPVVFLPNYGEFGPVIDKLIKIVHFCRAPRKIICCKRGEEAYYPSASEYFYDWNYDVIEDKYRWGFFTKGKLTYTGKEKIRNTEYDKHKVLAEKDIGNIKAHFGETCEYYDLRNLNAVDWIWSKDYSHLFRFDLKPITEQNLYADIVISPRNKQARPDNNFDWSSFVSIMNMNNFSIGLIGAQDTSKITEGYKHASWETKDNASACIELLRKCKIFVGLDTGTAHLASFLSVPMIVFQGNRPSSSGTWVMKKMTKNYFVDLGHGVTTDSVVAKTMEFLCQKQM